MFYIIMIFHKKILHKREGFLYRLFIPHISISGLLKSYNTELNLTCQTARGYKSTL